MSENRMRGLLGEQEPVRLFGIPDTDLTREELLTALRWAGAEKRRVEKAYAKELQASPG